MPDISLISWSDIVALVQRIRTILPNQRIVVDIDDMENDNLMDVRYRFICPKDVMMWDIPGL